MKYGIGMNPNSRNGFQKGRKIFGKNNPSWKGDKAKYDALHIRVGVARGRPRLCEVCGTTNKQKKYDWANLTGKYLDVMDYKRMCVSCHRKYDKNWRKRNG